MAERMIAFPLICCSPPTHTFSTRILRFHSYIDKPAGWSPPPSSALLAISAGDRSARATEAAAATTAASAPPPALEGNQAEPAEWERAQKQRPQDAMSGKAGVGGDVGEANKAAGEETDSTEDDEEGPADGSEGREEPTTKGQAVKGTRREQPAPLSKYSQPQQAQLPRDREDEHACRKKHPPPTTSERSGGVNGRKAKRARAEADRRTKQLTQKQGMAGEAAPLKKGTERR